MNTTTRLTAAVFVACSLLAWIVTANAQILDSLASVQAYTGADPVDPARLALATPDGRFAIVPVQGCDWLAPYEQVLIYPNWAVPPWLGLSGTDAAEPGCVVRVEGRMDAT